MLISLAQYAEKHGKAYTTVRDLVQRGKLHTAYKVGRNYVVEEDEPYPVCKRDRGTTVTLTDAEFNLLDFALCTLFQDAEEQLLDMVEGPKKDADIAKMLYHRAYAASALLAKLREKHGRDIRFVPSPRLAWERYRAICPDAAEPEPDK